MHVGAVNRTVDTADDRGEVLLAVEALGTLERQVNCSYPALVDTNLRRVVLWKDVHYGK